jgi:hypothetical protein
MCYETEEDSYKRGGHIVDTVKITSLKEIQACLLASAGPERVGEVDLSWI